MAIGDDIPLEEAIAVPSSDPEKKEEKKQANGDAKGKGKEENDVPDIVSRKDQATSRAKRVDDAERGGSAIEGRAGNARRAFEGESSVL
jgi:hypothetical protein